MQLKKTAIGPDGQVVEISLATGKTITSMRGNDYGQMIAAEKAARGWVDYDSFDDEKARDALIESRRAIKNKKNADYAKLFETKLDRLAAVLEANAVGPARPVLTDDQLQAALVEPEPAKAKKSK